VAARGRPGGRPGAARATLAIAVDTFVRLLAPFLPFATEEVWSWYREGSVHTAPWPVVADLAGVEGDPSVLEAATIDGCNGVQRFFKVVFPMISPTVFFCTVMTIIGAFKVFAQPYFLTLGGPGEATNTIVLALYRNGFSFDKLGYASAMAWVLFVIVMTVTALQFAGQKKWVNYDA